MKLMRICVFLGAIAILRLGGSLALAADTIEAFNVGITDLEFYTDYSFKSQFFGFETLVGAGLTERISIGVAHKARVSQDGNALLSEIEFEFFHALLGFIRIPPV